MERLLQSISRVSVYIDDILITGSSVKDNLQTLDKVLERLESSGLRLNVLFSCMIKLSTWPT